MDSQRGKNHLYATKGIIQRLVAESPGRLTPAAIRNTVMRRAGMGRRTIARAIHELVAEKAMVYTNQFGCTFLELSFNKPVRISPAITLKPPDVVYQPGPGETVVNIAPGAAFGSGEHPTTRLALQGIAYAVAERCRIIEPGSRTLDIGTGSGVLAIAAMLMGVDRAIGLDLDPCARVEAEKNARLNGLEARIHIAGALDEPDTHHFALVTANLRTPTLKELQPLVESRTANEGGLVMSGVKADEVPDIKKTYGGGRFSCQWEKTEKDWAGLVFFADIP